MLPETIFHPKDHDVLLGRGRPFQTHPGNERMKTIVKPYMSGYQSSHRPQKAKIIEHVIRVIRDSPPPSSFKMDHEGTSQISVAPSTRFLKINPKVGEDHDDSHCLKWIEASETEIFNKISHCLRHKDHKRVEQNAPRGGSKSPAYNTYISKLPVVRTSIIARTADSTKPEDYSCFASNLEEADRIVVEDISRPEEEYVVPRYLFLVPDPGSSPPSPSIFD
jgi:hypothetical protein